MSSSILHTDAVIGTPAGVEAVGPIATPTTLFLNPGIASDITYSFDTFSIPPGAIVVGIYTSIRASTPSLNGTAPTITLTIGGVDKPVFIGTTFPATYYAAPMNGERSQAEIDGLTLRIRKPGTQPQVTITSITIQVDYVEQANLYADSPGDHETLTTTNLPLIDWHADVDPIGGDITKWKLEIISTTLGLIEIAEGAGAPTPYQGKVPLADGDYSVAFFITQHFNGTDHTTLGGVLAFSVNVNKPGVPLLAVDTYPDQGWVGISVTPTAGAATTDYIAVERSVNGSMWERIRTHREDGLMPVSEFDAVDWEAPIGAELAYRAHALHAYGATLAASAWTADATAELDSAIWWLKHPTDHTLAMPVTIHSWPTTTRAARRGTHQALGSSVAITIADERAATTTSVVLRVDTKDERTKLDRLLNTLSPLLLCGPPDEVWDDSYVDVGDLTRARLTDKSFRPETLETLPLTVAERPTDPVSVPWPDLMLLGDMVDGGTPDFTPDTDYDGGTP